MGRRYSIVTNARPSARNEDWTRSFQHGFLEVVNDLNRYRRGNDEKPMEAHGEMQENERQSGTVRKTENTDVHTGNARSDANRLTTDRHNARKLASHTRDNDGDFNGRCKERKGGGVGTIPSSTTPSKIRVGR